MCNIIYNNCKWRIRTHTSASTLLSLNWCLCQKLPRFTIIMQCIPYSNACAPHSADNKLLLLILWCNSVTSSDGILTSKLNSV